MGGVILLTNPGHVKYMSFMNLHFHSLIHPGRGMFFQADVALYYDTQRRQYEGHNIPQAGLTQSHHNDLGLKGQFDS